MPSLARIRFAGLLLALTGAHGFAADIEDIFRAEDTNGDGAISVDEARVVAPANFLRIDRDASGGVEAQEIAEFTAAESGPDGVWPADVLASVARKTLEYWDGNRDGKVTEAEYADAAVALMLLADADGNREVTREELQRFRGEAASPR